MELINFDESDLGAAMLELNPRQRLFVVAMVESSGHIDHTTAAKKAGYLDGPGIRVAAHRLAHNPKILRAIREYAERMINAGAVRAAQVLLELLENPDPKVRAKVADNVLNRAGLQVTTKHAVEVTDRRSSRELMDFIKKAAAEQGLDPRKLLGQAGVSKEAIDGEFEEVTASSEIGLEDILG